MPLKLTRHILPLLMTTAYAITGHAQTDSMHGAEQKHRRIKKKTERYPTHGGRRSDNE